MVGEERENVLPSFLLSMFFTKRGADCGEGHGLAQWSSQQRVAVDGHQQLSFTLCGIFEVLSVCLHN